MLTSCSTSPSVYVIYHTLQADYNCDGASVVDVGPTYDAVTIGYPPDALSTGVCYHTNWMPINYTELYYPPPDYEVITEAACSMPVGDPRTVDSLPILAGSPIFSIPHDVSQINPLWSSCTPAAPGGYDPPRALTKAANLVPTPVLPPVTQAQPESSATLQLAAETGAPGTPNGGNAAHVPQDPSTPGGTDNQDPGASSSPGAEGGGDLGSTTGNQNGNAGSQQAPGAKVNQPDPQTPSTSNVPSPGNGGSSGSSGSSPQDNSGNVEPGSSAGSKESGSDPSNPSVLDDPGSASKGESGSDSPQSNSNGGSEIGTSLHEASGGGLQLGTHIIAPGAQTTHSGHVFSVGSSFVLVDGTSFDLQSSPAGALGSPPTGSPSQQDSVGGGGGGGGGVVIGTTTFPPGIQTTYAGHTISVGSSIFPIDGTSYKEAAGGGLIFGTTTLSPGSQITQSGHIISIGSSVFAVDGTSYKEAAGGGLVSGTSTLPPGSQITQSGHIVSVGSSVFAIDGTSYKEAAGGGLILGTTTLPAGSQITQSGHIISVGSSSVIIDGTSYTWAAGTSSPSSRPANDNLGGLIMSAFGTGAAANSSSTSSPLAFTGDAARSRPGMLAITTTAMMAFYIMYIFIL